MYILYSGVSIYVQCSKGHATTPGGGNIGTYDALVRGTLQQSLSEYLFIVWILSAIFPLFMDFFMCVFV
jgi:hypothetical protein